MPFSALYGKITDLRNTLFERGILRSHALGAPTVSVGNITVGGTGKTPMVAYVAGVLAEEDRKVCILTRGYGRENPKQKVLVSDGERVLATAREAGDEPFELAGKLLGKAIVIADADRAAAAQWALENFEIDAFVLDDGFQHRRARRDLDIVLLDATDPFGGGRTLPFGRLREPLAGLARADLIVITRANLAENISSLKSQISNYNSNCPILTAENKISQLTPLADFLDNRSLRSQVPSPESLAFCALGNPENFFEQLRRENFRLTATRAFPDHHRYAQSDITKLEAEAREKSAGALLTTAKDAVKLAGLRFELPCFVVEVEMRFDDEKKLRRVIGAVLTKNPKSKI